ncbi:winged helix-turn-helix domain-containing protein [Dyella sp. ASV21]|uniref:winged helix-turn-helix domain-containing protein n=1 Tax=Dyella sp. ASV21 TaxID=2795114 RepID=UPI0018EBB1C0|nr:winged helix-turn-helix domain-containing protein [Dyella sp. ASV21]
MDQPEDAPFHVGTWLVDPALGQISRDGEVVRLDARAMRLLQCLAGRAGAVVSLQELLDHVWAGTIVSPDSVYQAIASLRRSLGDDPRQSSYIATVPRLGYRMVAHVVKGAAGGNGAALEPTVHPVEVLAKAVARKRHRLWLAAACVLTVALALYTVLKPLGADSYVGTAEKCVAVLPFRDMTDAMDEEPFADGMTEQLINTLSSIPGAHVPSLTSSLYFKGKQATIAEIAQKLGVAYVLEGSVRKSGNTLRITAQLIRADGGYVVWSSTYDRPTNDLLLVQSDIATQVKHALEASLRQPGPGGSS